MTTTGRFPAMLLPSLIPAVVLALLMLLAPLSFAHAEREGTGVGGGFGGDRPTRVALTVDPDENCSAGPARCLLDRWAQGEVALRPLTSSERQRQRGNNGWAGCDREGERASEIRSVCPDSAEVREEARGRYRCVCPVGR